MLHRFAVHVSPGQHSYRESDLDDLSFMAELSPEYSFPSRYFLSIFNIPENTQRVSWKRDAPYRLQPWKLNRNPRRRSWIYLSGLFGF